LDFVRLVNLKKYFPVQKSFLEQLVSRRDMYVRAVDDVNLSVAEGTIHGLVGESGSGKTTTGRVTIGLMKPSSGKVFYMGKDLWSLTKKEFEEARMQMRLVFQDPMSSLNPRMKVGDAVADPLRYRGERSPVARRKAASSTLELVGLSPASMFYDRYPHELSGGQRQRVVIARALVTSPKYIVADEPVAMVDVSVRAQIIELLLSLKREMDLTMLMITHDLAVAKYMCDTVSIMYLGKIVEEGTVQDIFGDPLHPYTQALLAAVPVPDPKKRTVKNVPRGEIPNPISPPSGCRFHPRCPIAVSRCSVEEPELRVVRGHRVACHLA
jgi:peptide/nickel transport system ATP-binding protein